MDDKISTWFGDFRVHGDNIVECERTMHLIADIFNFEINYERGPLYAPVYSFINEDKKVGSIQLFPGYGRWGIDLQKVFQDNGAPLRESTDAVLTKIRGEKEEIIFSIEFCNALPAGNNAWQRTGRALANACAHVPYLYFADIGGVELDEIRGTKAHRYPNPIIPFAYILLGYNYQSITLPIYAPSPSSSEEIRFQFKDAFGITEGKELIRRIILEEDTSSAITGLIKKTLQLVAVLSELRKRDDTLKRSEWNEFLKAKNWEEKTVWLQKKKMAWMKKTSEKVKTTETFRKLIPVVKSCGAIAVGASDIPICLVPASERRILAKRILEVYNGKIDNKFISWINSTKSGLVIVWITGFKPRGDDSRPDRGLVPLARMIFGPDIDILSIVYGPATKSTWVSIQQSIEELARQNGLWQSIINLSNGVLMDSITMDRGPITRLINHSSNLPHLDVKFPLATEQTAYSEQDVDSVIHLFFTKSGNRKIVEGMCNPPGGDWSGLTLFNFENQSWYRWTSLPRVSKISGKRPDHVMEIKINSKVIILSIESKEKRSDFETNIGRRLNNYTSDLIEKPANIMRSKLNGWVSNRGATYKDEKVEFLSGGAYIWDKMEGLQSTFHNGNFDVLFSLEFPSTANTKIKLHIMVSKMGEQLVDIFHELNRDGLLEIEVH